MTTIKNINKDSKIVVVKNDNPRRVGTASHKRARAVLTAHGKSVADAIKAGARTSTVRHFAEIGAIRLAAAKVAPKKAAAK